MIDERWGRSGCRDYSKEGGGTWRLVFSILAMFQVIPGAMVRVGVLYCGEVYLDLGRKQDLVSYHLCLRHFGLHVGPQVGVAFLPLVVLWRAFGRRGRRLRPAHLGVEVRSA